MCQYQKYSFKFALKCLQGVLQAKHFSRSPFDNLNKMVTRYYKFWLPEGRKCSWVVLIILFYGGFEIMNMASLHLARWNLEVHAITSQGFIHEFFYPDKFQAKETKYIIKISCKWRKWCDIKLPFFFLDICHSNQNKAAWIVSSNTYLVPSVDCQL